MKKPYEWDFDGACAPGSSPGRYETFSLGVFQWLPKAGGKGVKRGKVVKRIKGRSSNPEPAYEAARAEVERRNTNEKENA